MGSAGRRGSQAGATLTRAAERDSTSTSRSSTSTSRSPARHRVPAAMRSCGKVRTLFTGPAERSALRLAAATACHRASPSATNRRARTWTEGGAYRGRGCRASPAGAAPQVGLGGQRRGRPEGSPGRGGSLPASRPHLLPVPGDPGCERSCPGEAQGLRLVWERGVGWVSGAQRRGGWVLWKGCRCCEK